jgi:hypothetical protein
VNREEFLLWFATHERVSSPAGHRKAVGRLEGRGKAEEEPFVTSERTNDAETLTESTVTAQLLDYSTTRTGISA